MPQARRPIGVPGACVFAAAIKGMLLCGCGREYQADLAAARQSVRHTVTGTAVHTDAAPMAAAIGTVPATIGLFDDDLGERLMISVRPAGQVHFAGSMALGVVVRCPAWRSIAVRTCL
jgi:hypothetical protein